MKRRTFLETMGAAALVGCGSKDGMDSATVATAEGLELLRQRIDTVVIVVMENRSFDHFLGALTLEEGRADVDGLTADMTNPHPDGGDVAPFRSEVDCLSDPPHSWNSSHAQFNDGANDGFVSEFYNRAGGEVAAEAMGYWTRERLSTTYTLADAGVVCDQWFCSLMTSTWPNRYYTQAATSAGRTGNDIVLEPIDSIYTRLDAAGLSSAVYFGNVPFAALLGESAPARMELIESFFEDAAAGTLPNLTMVEPVYGRNDDHPPAHPVAGQVLLASIYEALASSPQWERCALLITYDEHGGFFDHVPPPKAADDRPDEGFDQLGFRVPSLVVGPWVKPGHVSHVVYDHSSMLAFVETLFELDPLTARDAAADSMLDCFDLEAVAALAPVSLPTITASDEEIYGPDCVFSAFRSVEPGATGQPELEAYADAHLAGTRLDRRADTNRIYEWLLDHARSRGLLQSSS